jgi:hypothetical protein
MKSANDEADHNVIFFFIFMLVLSSEHKIKYIKLKFILMWN